MKPEAEANQAMNFKTEKDVKISNFTIFLRKVWWEAYLKWTKNNDHKKVTIIKVNILKVIITCSQMWWFPKK